MDVKIKHNDSYVPGSVTSQIINDIRFDQELKRKAELRDLMAAQKSTPSKLYK